MQTYELYIMFNSWIYLHCTIKGNVTRFWVTDLLEGIEMQLIMRLIKRFSFLIYVNCFYPFLFSCIFDVCHSYLFLDT